MNILKTHFFLIIFLLLVHLNIGAQSLFDLYVPNNGTVSEFPFKLITEIKSYDDFIGRYNGELNIYGEKINFSNNITRLDSISILRTKIIGSLVTQAYLQSNYDKVLEFSTMAGNGPKLDFSKTQHIVVGWDWKLASDWRSKVELYHQRLFDIPVEEIASSFSVLNYGADFGFPTVGKLSLPFIFSSSQTNSAIPDFVLTFAFRTSIEDDTER